MLIGVKVGGGGLKWVGTIDVTHHTFNIFFFLVPWDMTRNHLKFLFVSLALLWHNLICLTL
jgi:hypothetical protein